MLRTSLLRGASSTLSPSARTRAIAGRLSQIRQRSDQKISAHAISNPTLANIEMRWEEMPPQEQADLWMALRDRMKVDWHEMTFQEKKAAYWIAFGPHGPRAVPAPGEGWWLFRHTAYALGFSAVIFALLRYYARPPPRTMTEEYQKASNEYLKRNNVEPITGISSEGYTGKGQVQSRPEGK